ncbi:MAG: RluA family pseudouridine synthase [Clostridia bacterium]|nr:RluA family pseudouridine synthase [Clostridia bacterium]
MMPEILYEDSSLIVCVKPAGLQSQGGKNDLVAVLDEYFASNGSQAKAYPVHRLDKETSGVMVFAKNSSSAAKLSSQITSNEMKKHYYAVVSGKPKEESGILKDLLFHDRQKNKTYTVKKNRKGVKEASLEYKTIGFANGFSMLDILLHTGRTHQIRVQFGSRKMPLYGDGKYGGGSGKLALFAYKLEFAHPKTKEPMCFTSKPDVSEIPWNKFETI